MASSRLVTRSSRKWSWRALNKNRPSETAVTTTKQQHWHGRSRSVSKNCTSLGANTFRRWIIALFCIFNENNIPRKMFLQCTLRKPGFICLCADTGMFTLTVLMQFSRLVYRNAVSFFHVSLAATELISFTCEGTFCTSFWGLLKGVTNGLLGCGLFTAMPPTHNAKLLRCQLTSKLGCYSPILRGRNSVLKGQNCSQLDIAATAIKCRCLQGISVDE